MDHQSELKKLVATAARTYAVEDAVVGIGSGSTWIYSDANHPHQMLGESGGMAAELFDLCRLTDGS